MELSPSAQRKLDELSRRAHVEDLLRKYPEVDSGETAEIFRFLRKGPPLDVALMGADDEFKGKLSAFRADHPAQFSLGLKHYLTVAAILVALVVLLDLLWDSGLGQ